MKPIRSFLPVLIAFALLLAVQLACAGGAAAPVPPAPTEAPAAAEPTQAGAVPTQAAAPTQAAVELPAAIPEARMLTLEFPPAIRAGDSDVVRLTLEVDDLGNLTPTVSVAGNTTQGQVIVIPNVYETHNVLAEARLDLAGVDVRPSETISETLLPRQKVTFYWSLQPAEIGRFKGTVWFYLHFVPKAGGVESRQALSAQPIEINATALFGIKADVARWLGLAGTVFGSVLSLPFLEQLLSAVWKRIRRQA
jgi:hypothetical protein